jgi:hypothetical protein
MDIGTFWEIIDSAREENGWEEIYEPLANRLAELEADEILLWANIFDEYHDLSDKSKLHAAAWIINGGCSEDGFFYFRQWLIAQGKKYSWMP